MAAGSRTDEWVDERDGPTDASAATRRLLEDHLSGVVQCWPHVEFIHDEPALATRLQIGRASAASHAAFASALAEIVRRRNGAAIADIEVDVRHAEVSTMGLFHSKVGGKGLIRSLILSPRARRGQRRMGMPPGMPATPIHRTADGRFFITHQSYDVRPLERALGCRYSARAIGRAIAERSADELEELMDRHGAVGTTFRTAHEWLGHEHGRGLASRPALKIEPIGGAYAPGRASLERPPSRSRPLEGVRVLDLTRVVAGPAAGRMLAAYGADCLKVSAAHLPRWEFIDRVENLGKRRAWLDARDPVARRKLRALAEAADVIVCSYRTGVLERLGLDPEALAARTRRGVVVVSISCFGAGPWEARGGYDQIAQMATGMSAAHMHDESGEAVPQLVPKCAANDYTTAQLAAYGALAGLIRRDEDGGSYRVSASLAQTAMWIQGFGTRDEVPDHRRGAKRLVPAVLNGPSIAETRPYRRVMGEGARAIEVFREPVRFPGSDLEPGYEASGTGAAGTAAWSDGVRAGRG